MNTRKLGMDLTDPTTDPNPPMYAIGSVLIKIIVIPASFME